MERALKRVESRAGRQRFDRPDLLADDARRERQAREPRLAIDHDGATAARTHVAPFLGAGQHQVFAQDVQEYRSRVRQHLTLDPVDLQPHQPLLRPGRQ